MKVCTLFGLVAMVASQTPTDDPATEFFNAMDGDNNNQLVISELYAYFDSLDTNGDGHLSLAEWAGGEEEPSDYVRGEFNFYDALDGQRDHRISRTIMPDFFSMVDSNGNGVSTYQEFKTEFDENVAPGIQAAMAELPVGK